MLEWILCRSCRKSNKFKREKLICSIELFNLKCRKFKSTHSKFSLIFSKLFIFGVKSEIGCKIQIASIKFIAYIIYVTFRFSSSLSSNSIYLDNFVAKSNESTSTEATKFALSPLTLSKGGISSNNSSGILMKTNISEVNMFSSLASYTENIHNNLQKHNKYLSTSIIPSGKNEKSKRSTETEVSVECEPFTVGDEVAKTFFSPGYPKEYTKNITCVRVIEGNIVHTLENLWTVKCTRFLAVKLNSFRQKYSIFFIFFFHKD